jgi:hypothetical protein
MMVARMRLCICGVCNRMMLNVVMSAEFVNSEGRLKRFIADIESSKYGLLTCVKGSFKGFHKSVVC